MSHVSGVDSAEDLWYYSITDGLYYVSSATAARRPRGFCLSGALPDSDIKKAGLSPLPHYGGTNKSPAGRQRLSLKSRLSINLWPCAVFDLLAPVECILPQLRVKWNMPFFVIFGYWSCASRSSAGDSSSSGCSIACNCTGSAVTTTCCTTTRSITCSTMTGCGVGSATVGGAL